MPRACEVSASCSALDSCISNYAEPAAIARHAAAFGARGFSRLFSSTVAETNKASDNATSVAPLSAVVPAPDSGAVSLWQQSRLQKYYQEVLYRELMLRNSEFSNRSLPMVPYLDCVQVEILSSKTELASELVDKKDFLLYWLALEHIVMAPVEFVTDEIAYNKGKVKGVRAVLKDVKKWEFLEKLIYLILPNQFAFVGVPYPKYDRNYVRVPMSKPVHTTTFEVGNIVVYPDYEDNFEMFERVKGMQVTLKIANGITSELSMLLLNGLGLPVLPKEDKRARIEAEKDVRRGRARGPPKVEKK